MCKCARVSNKTKAQNIRGQQPWQFAIELSSEQLLSSHHSTKVLCVFACVSIAHTLHAFAQFHTVPDSAQAKEKPFFWLQYISRGISQNNWHPKCEFWLAWTSCESLKKTLCHHKFRFVSNCSTIRSAMRLQSFTGCYRCNKTLCQAEFNRFCLFLMMTRVS